MDLHSREFGFELQPAAGRSQRTVKSSWADACHRADSGTCIVPTNQYPAIAGLALVFLPPGDRMLPCFIIESDPEEVHSLRLRDDMIKRVCPTFYPIDICQIWGNCASEDPPI